MLISLIQDHPYNLPDAAVLKARLQEAEDRRSGMQRELRNARDREKRLRVSCQSLLETLKEKMFVTEELSARLECFSGKLYGMKYLF